MIHCCVLFFVLPVAFTPHLPRNSPPPPPRFEFPRRLNVANYTKPVLDAKRLGKKTTVGAAPASAEEVRAVHRLPLSASLVCSCSSPCESANCELLGFELHI